MLVQQEEEEWHEVLAQHDSFQQAELVEQATQVTGKAGNSPNADHNPGALNAAQAPVLSDAVGRDSEGESMQADAVMPAAENQPKSTTTVSSTYVHMSEDL